jgi:Protein of unknown function (DUF2891)
VKLHVTQAERFATFALDCVHKEFPNKISHSLNSYEDVKPPRELTPAFFGCYDWHSAVHNHWALARLARLFSEASFALHAKRALKESITNRNIAQEVRYLNTEGREAFERPYGLAWLLQLAAELKEWDAPEARDWSANLSPLEMATRGRLAEWLSRLDRPVRTGEHNNTAFAMGLMLDHARITGHSEFGKLVESRARHFYFKDENCPLSYEPSGEDFFSPCLAEADLMRRILPSGEFTSWFTKFLPHIHLEPTYAPDEMDGKLGHLIGLNLSRAWMLEGIISRLPAADARSEPLSLIASKLTQAGLNGIQRENYQGAHWLGTFAVYLLSGRAGSFG